LISASGDFALIGRTLQIVGELLNKSVDVRGAIAAASLATVARSSSIVQSSG
jgi:hypothetical protein